MPARDHLDEHVRKALVSDGWTITHDPLRLRWGKKDVYADLGAERFVGRLKLLVFNAQTEVIQRWTPEPPTAK